MRKNTDNVIWVSTGSVADRPFDMFPRNLCQFAKPEEVRLILRGGNEIMKSRYEKLHNFFQNER